jgi:hypothetical protein
MQRLTWPSLRPCREDKAAAQAAGSDELAIAGAVEANKGVRKEEEV